MVEEGGFLYDADAYNDDLPYWTVEAGRPHLVVPYTLDNNDMKFATPQGFSTGDEWLAYVRDAFDVLYAEGAEHPQMMSVGLPMRLMGRPGRTAALVRFLDHCRAPRPRLDLPAPRHRPTPAPASLTVDGIIGAWRKRDRDQTRVRLANRVRPLNPGHAPDLA